MADFDAVAIAADVMAFSSHACGDFIKQAETCRMIIELCLQRILLQRRIREERGTRPRAAAVM